MKKKLFIIVPIVVFIIIVILVSIILLYDYNYKLKYEEKISIKVGEKIPEVKNYVLDKEKKVKQAKISWENLKNEDGKVFIAGSYKGKLTYRKITKEIILEVIDDEKPTITGSKDLKIFENEKIDLLKDIKTTDNSHSDVKLEVIGDYDTNKIGEYKLSYVATDASNNTTQVDFKLTVEKKPVVKPPVVSLPSRYIGTTSKGYKIEQKNGVYYVGGIIIANKTYQLPSSYAPGGLLYEFTNAFYKMKSEARNSGINLNVISGYRSYYDQRYIYNNYVNRDGQSAADTYSARAGHSEHQLGLAADINSLIESFADTNEGKWLNNNCYKYGFIIRYPRGKESITGYIFEPWHIRYVGTDLATKLYNNGEWITLEEYLGITSKYN